MLGWTVVVRDGVANSGSGVVDSVVDLCVVGVDGLGWFDLGSDFTDWDWMLLMRGRIFVVAMCLDCFYYCDIGYLVLLIWGRIWSSRDRIVVMLLLLGCFIFCVFF